MTLKTQLPRSLETVQFLRVVPLGSDGEEFDFSQCGIVAVAVPESRRPAPPRLDAAIDRVTGKAVLTVSTDAVDEVVLKRDEPGLFNAGRPGDKPPLANIRRAVAGVADSIYARAVGVPKPMVRDAATERYSATLEDDNGGRGLEPFVSYVYWAEWRMPAERRLPADFQELPSDVTPLDPAAAQSRPRPKSAPSAPRVVMRIPPNAPAAPLAADVRVTQSPGATPDRVALQIEFAHPPRAHKLAMKRYRMAMWSKWNVGAIEPIRKAGGVLLEGSWPSIEDGTLATEVTRPADATTLTLMLAFVDPADRLGAVTTVPVPQP